MTAAAPPRRRLPGAPIWAQILILLLGGLVVAQAVTLALTVLLPPAPPQQHSLTDIATALRGGALDGGQGRPLIRSLEREPPSLQSLGWMVSARSTRDLARLLDAPEDDVRLLFYSPPPLAGANAPPPRGPPPQGAPPGPPPGPPPGQPQAQASTPIVLAGLVLAQAGPRPGGPHPGAAPSPGVMTGRAEPAAGGPGATRAAPAAPGVGPQGARAPGAGALPGAARAAPMAERAWPRADQYRPPQDRPVPHVYAPARSPLDAAVFDMRRAVVMTPPTPASSAPAADTPAAAVPKRLESSTVIALPPAVEAAAPVATRPLTRTGPAPIATAVSAPPAAEPRPERALPAPTAPGVFGLARAPFVEGEFVAALRTADGWVTVRPQPEGFPTSWQRRVLLWFGLSFAIVAPLGYLLARRLTAPLNRFANAAERLGRDPSADLEPLAGPAEVGRAADAFNLMRGRLRRYVDDRTGMVGAISHDLRTPLARMRFKLERAPPALRAALGRDIAQMEQMISSVLSFMRDGAEAEARATVDLRSILECVVDDAADGAELSAGASVAVEVDVLAMQRVFENLVDNALKYGGGAEVRLRVEGGEAVVEVADRGPGLTAEELELAFKPFYRSAAAKASGKGGMGLGLAVSRSTVRAHGGELRLVPGDDGLTAEVRIPTAPARALAA